MITLHDAALAYASHGYHVFPLAPRSKEPFPASRGFKDATTDLEITTRVWHQHPDANIGLHPGPSGFVVVDVDGPEGRAAAVALGLFSEPTLAVVTGREGGVHLYFQHPGFPVSNRPLAPHLDVRADDGYVLLPPSIHPSGAQYRWDRAPVLALPPDVLAALQNGSAPRPATPLATGIPIPEGMRNTMLASLAGTMRRRGMEAGEIAVALRAVNAARCRPALDDDEVEAIAQSVSRYPPADAGRVPLRLETRDDVPPPEPEQADRVRAEEPMARARSLAEVLQNPESQQPPRAVIPRLAWAGRSTLVAANEEVGKSTLLAGAAAAVTTGGEFLGERCVQGTVLWVLLEEHLNDLVLRAGTFQTVPDRLYILERPDSPLAALAAEVARLQPTVTIIDTLHQFAAGAIADASAAEQWAPTMTALDRLARTTGTALLMSAKAARSTGLYRDSSEIGHGVDVVLALVRPEKDSHVRRLERQKARWQLADVQFDLIGNTYRLGGAVTKKLSKQRQKVLDALEPPMSYTEWHEASGVPERTFTRARTFLVGHGYVHQADDTYTLATPDPKPDADAPL